MKILFYTLQSPNLFHGIIADYMSDLLYHGLYQLFGDNAVDFPSKSHLEVGYPNKDKLWGRGFTLGEILPSNRPLYNPNINEYDIIFLSIHHTMHDSPNLVLEWLENNKSLNTKIVIVDGNDRTNYEPRFFDYTKYYFKREIPDDADEHLIPIHFAIPEEKVLTQLPEKIKDFAYINPGSCEAHWPNDSRKTHIYTNEKDYYDDYRTARFAFTCKKGGWDCMRHYEIMANGCLPIFTDIEWCPKRTLTNLPKSTLLDIVKRLPGLKLATRSENKITYGGYDIIQGESQIDWNYFDCPTWNLLAKTSLDFTRKYLTTKALAEYVLEEIND